MHIKHNTHCVSFKNSDQMKTSKLSAYQTVIDGMDAIKGKNPRDKYRNENSTLKSLFL